MQILKIKTKKRITGDIGEDSACLFLKKKGYKILERNYVDAGHEIDIIARSKEAICFVEVKTRSYTSVSGLEARPAAAVTPKKQRAILKAASAYAAVNYTDMPLRLDVIEVYLNSCGKVEKIEHLEGAFNKNTAFARK